MNLGNEECFKTLEVVIPQKLRSGEKLIGTTIHKGKEVNAYIEEGDSHLGRLPVCVLGPVGSGKDSFIENYVFNCTKSNESTFVVDFVDNCELSRSIKNNTPSDKIVEIDLSSTECLQGFGFNEVYFNEGMSDLEKLGLANLQAIETMSLIHSIKAKSTLTSRENRYISAASIVVYIQNGNRIKDVIDCLTDYKVREQYINLLNPIQKASLSKEIRILNELNSYSKDENPKVIGTINSKIEPIIDKINFLRENFILNIMYTNGIEKNIDLSNCIDEGKVALIKIGDSAFPNQSLKDILITYFVSKIFISARLKAYKNSTPNKCSLVINELNKSSTLSRNLSNLLPQSRALGIKVVFSSHFLLNNSLDVTEQVPNIVLLRGCNQEVFDKLKDRFEEFQFNDYLNMPLYQAMCSIRYSEGCSNFIAKLLPPLSMDR